MSHHCLNCQNPISGNYCEACGQKTSTHRFSLRHIFSHDFVQGVLELDKGFFYTLKELVTRPGHSIREYVAGKRVNHFNYFTLLLLLVSIDIILQQFSTVKLREIYESANENEQIAGIFDKLVNDYQKIFTLTLIPLYALFSWIFFRKAKQNFAEHLVLNAYRTAGEALIGMLLTICMIFIQDVSVLRIINSFIVIIAVVYAVTFYYQYFSVFPYSRAALVFRSLLASTLLVILPAIIIIIVVALQNLVP